MTWHTLRLHLLALAAASAAALVLSSCDSTDAFTTGSGHAGVEHQQTQPHVAADTTPGHCQGRVGSVSVDGDVTVPAGATCELVGTTVGGNVSIGHAARLYARGVDVDGDVEGEGAAVVDVSADSTIGGNVQLESGGTAAVRDSHVDGDLSWEHQHGVVSVEHATVRGNLQADGNHGGVTVAGTEVGGDLSCEGNTPAPRGGQITVAGDREGQCHGL